MAKALSVELALQLAAHGLVGDDWLKIWAAVLALSEPAVEALLLEAGRRRERLARARTEHRPPLPAPADWRPEPLGLYVMGALEDVALERELIAEGYSVPDAELLVQLGRIEHGDLRASVDAARAASGSLGRKSLA